MLRCWLTLSILAISIPAVADTGALAELGVLLERYRNLVTYQDSGILSTSASGFKDVIVFSSERFANGDYRLSWKDRDRPLIPGQESVLRITSGNVSSSWNGEVEAHESIDRALGSFAGVSGGLTTSIPRFLFPGQHCCSLKNATAVSLEKLATSDSSILRVQFGAGAPRRYWIDASGLIHRIEWEITSKGKTFRHVIELSSYRATPPNQSKKAQPSAAGTAVPAAPF